MCIHRLGLLHSITGPRIITAPAFDTTTVRRGIPITGGDLTKVSW